MSLRDLDVENYMERMSHGDGRTHLDDVKHLDEERSGHDLRMLRTVGMGSDVDSKPYREGYEYVVCDECRSEVLIDLETRQALFEDDDDEQAWIGFTCDWDPCGADCSALVANPFRETPQP